jgi:hypothetical protein
MGTHENWETHVLLDVLKMDITFWNDDTFVYVWQTGRPDPLTKVGLGAGAAPFPILGGDFPGVAALHASTLKFERIGSRANP